MIILGFDTAQKGCAIALFDTEHGVIQQRFEPMVRGQDARLPGLVQQTLTKAGRSLSDLNRIAVVTGPGSFTGIRIGVAFARGLALALNCSCVGVTSQEATLPLNQQGSALVLLPAQRRAPDITYWVQGFRSGEATDTPVERPLEHIARDLTAHPHQIYGQADALLEAHPDLEVRQATPDAAIAAERAARFDPGLHPPNPVYARLPDAVPSL